ncbi:TPA: hypothetical protein IYB51_002707 [Enterococcus faecium]|nr:MULTISPECIES: hypothetical protein [Bacteria]MDZ1652576.1 hypothetical protein [Klebsiella pneumoniae]EHM33886.1 Hypothetical protein EfmE4453_2268 [Enterococcus faecium E4453]EHM36254.1 Hypothetical protein EfmE4452_0537 [Enterococcus faecium E4452]EJX67899.1 hypothetical protein HMPREF1375_00552 [Enterococcus faecium P1986]KAB7560062.1 hypothetical protein GBM31_14525 [Enterococcus faecium]
MAKMDIEDLEKKLAEARHDLSVKIGTNMVEKQGFKSYSAYNTFMRNASKALKSSAGSAPAPAAAKPVATSAEKLPSELKAEAVQFQKQLEKWMEDNWGNKLDYKTFYPELLEFFQKLNSLE